MLPDRPRPPEKRTRATDAPQRSSSRHTSSSANNSRRPQLTARKSAPRRSHFREGPCAPVGGMSGRAGLRSPAIPTLSPPSSLRRSAGAPCRSTTLHGFNAITSPQRSRGMIHVASLSVWLGGTSLWGPRSRCRPSRTARTGPIAKNSPPRVPSARGRRVMVRYAQKSSPGIADIAQLDRPFTSLQRRATHPTARSWKARTGTTLRSRRWAAYYAKGRRQLNASSAPTHAGD